MSERPVVLSFDYETTKIPVFLPWQAGSYGVSLHIVTSTGERKTWLINHPEATQTTRECLDEIQTYFDRAEVAIAHNAKFDLHWNQFYGITLGDNCRVYCTLLAEYVIEGHAVNMQGLSLNDLAGKYKLPLKFDKVKEYWDAGYQTDEIPANILTGYGEHDAELALQVYLLQQARIDKRKLHMLIRLEMESLLCFQEMEWNGMLLDVAALEVYHKQYTQELEELDDVLAQLLGITNLSSSDQLSCGLFGGTLQVDGRVPGKRPGTTKNGKIPKEIKGVGFKPKEEWKLKKEGMFSTSTDVIIQLGARTKVQKEIKAKLLERSRKDQLNKTYFKGLLSRVVDGYVHCNINQTITKTGRLSCSNPNLQNIPRGGTGPVKYVFISRFT